MSRGVGVLLSLIGLGLLLGDAEETEACKGRGLGLLLLLAGSGLFFGGGGGRRSRMT